MIPISVPSVRKLITIIRFLAPIVRIDPVSRVRSITTMKRVFDTKTTTITDNTNLTNAKIPSYIRFTLR